MDKQKDALFRILSSVLSKYEETEKFTEVVRRQMEYVRRNYEESISEVENQFKVLANCLEKSRNRMIAQIEEELYSKISPLEECLKNFDKAKNSTDDLIQMSRSALQINNHSEFSQAALKIKDGVTISPIFRLNLSPFEVSEECFFCADFSHEQKILNELTFLPVPNQASIVESGCSSENNSVHCQWSIAEGEEMLEKSISLASESILDTDLPRSVTYFILQYRQIDDPSENSPWITVEFIRSLQYDIKALCFSKSFLEFRVQAWNQALGGSWSKPYAIPTPAFNFSLNPDAAHPNLKITSHDFVEWDSTGLGNKNKVTPETTRIKSATRSRSTSPLGASSPRRSRPKDRFTGESYTVLADTPFGKEEAYFEVAPSSECKTFLVGVTHKSLARFDQLGKTQTSWCLYVSNWIQNTFVAKHNNKVKNLESVGEIPSKIGLYFNQPVGILSFYNAETQQHIYTFKQVKCNGQILPGFHIWHGSLQVFTGIQVPSWVSTKSVNSLNRKTSSASLTISSDPSTPE